MKKRLLTILLALTAITAGAQTVKCVEPDAQAYIDLLTLAGYKAYKFEIPESAVGHMARFVIKEFKDGKEVSLDESDFGSMINSFSFDVGSSTIIVGFLPEKEGVPMRTVAIKWKGSMDLAGPFVYKYLITDCIDFMTGDKREPYSCYSTVENKEEIEYKEKTFLPLCLLGSAYNVPDQGYKFCGDFKDLCESSPHYYVIGIVIF